eukprot:8963725-Alexandrium_andersonii.AAC.1
MSASLVGSEMCIRDRGEKRLGRDPESARQPRTASQSSGELRTSVERPQKLGNLPLAELGGALRR